MTNKGINPYVERIFGEWFKNIVILILLIISGIVFSLSVKNMWIDKELSLQIVFLIMGSILGAWISNGKK